MAEKKPVIALALEAGASKKKRPGFMPDEEDDMDESEPDIDVDDDIVTAASAVRSAMKSGDDGEFAKALKGFIKLCC